MRNELIAAERALAKWKRKNYRVEGATVNKLVKMVQADHRDFDGSELSRETAYRILMLHLKDDALIFVERVREYLMGEKSAECQHILIRKSTLKSPSRRGSTTTSRKSRRHTASTGQT